MENTPLPPDPPLESPPLPIHTISSTPARCKTTLNSLAKPFTNPSSSHPSTQPSFRDLFLNPNPSIATRRLQFIQQTEVDSVPLASCLRKEVEEASVNWLNDASSFLVGKKPFLPTLKVVLCRKWCLPCSLDVTVLSNGTICFKFGSRDEKNRVLESGLSFVNGHILILKSWRLNLSSFSINTIPVWIQLPELPLEFWSLDSLGRIGITIGHPLFIDETTSTQSRIGFARLCVEVSATRALPDSIWVEVEGYGRFLQKIVYEWKPSRCGKCLKFFHAEINCRSLIEKGKKVISLDPPSTDLPSTSKTARPRRKRRRKHQNAAGQEVFTGVSGSELGGRPGGGIPKNLTSLESLSDGVDDAGATVGATGATTASDNAVSSRPAIGEVLCADVGSFEEANEQNCGTVRSVLVVGELDGSRLDATNDIELAWILEGGVLEHLSLIICLADGETYEQTSLDGQAETNDS